MSVIDVIGHVLVPIERLRRLEELEALEMRLPSIIAKAKEEANAERFAALRERDKADPEGHRRRSLEWKQRNKEVYNAKRREQYKLKKAASIEPPGVETRPLPEK